MKPRLYVPLDVDYLDDEKFDKLSPEAELLYLRSLCLCKRRASDGHIAAGQLRRLSDRLEYDPEDLASELVAVRLWHEAEGGGWVVSAYLKHNPSQADIEERRRKDAERKTAGRSTRTPNVSARTENVSTRTPNVSQRTESVSSTNRGNTEAETEAAAEAHVRSDHDRTIELLLLRRRKQHEQGNGKPIGNPDAWNRSVRAGIETEHGDRIDAELALGLSPDTIAAAIIPLPTDRIPAWANQKLI